MKEKNGIEKLIELYYEHKLDLLKRDMKGNGATEREIELADIEKVEEDELERNLNKLSELKPFIKRLVENEKIDVEGGPLYGCQLIMHNRQPYTLYETVLMLLAIEDEPIDFLISILK